jgi:SAM-dependent methyltransferase
VIPKPAHLGRRYASQFDDESVARAYHTRPPYVPETFAILAGLLAKGPRTVLDLGCGTGDAALGIAPHADHVDAVDPSPAMLRVARARPGADDPRLRFILSSAETFRPETRYSLIVAAESLHWTQWELVLPSLARALRPGAFLALVSGRELIDVPWSDELARLIPRYSTNREYRPYDLVAELTRRGLFLEAGRRSTEPVAFAQPLEDYVLSFHTRNGFSRERMTRQAAREFDGALGRMVGPHLRDGRVHGHTLASVVWGRPSSEAAPPR